MADPAPEGGPLLGPFLAFALVLLITFILPAIFLYRLRNAERHRPEPWRVVLEAFAWGGTIAVAIAIGVELLLEPYFRGVDPIFGVVSLSLVVLAPLVEEPAKALGLFFLQDHDPEPEDGFIYGGAAGLGFAATENLIFVTVAFLVEGQDVALITAIYRGFVTVALHGATTALVGYGIWRWRYFGRDSSVWLAFAAALVLHGAYNGIVEAAPVVAALASGILAIFTYTAMRRRVKALDAGPPPGP